MIIIIIININFNCYRFSNEQGNHGLAKELLVEHAQAQMEVRRDGTGDAAIHLCAKRRDLEMMKLLVDRGCNLNIKNVCISRLNWPKID